MDQTAKGLSERVCEAKKILQNILVRDAEEGVHDNDVERAYNVLTFGNAEVKAEKSA